MFDLNCDKSIEVGAFSLWLRLMKMK